MNGAAPGAPPQPSRVLVVDGDRTMRMLAGETLIAAGFSVRTAVNATQAPLHPADGPRRVAAGGGEPGPALAGVVYDHIP